jgi:SAM-dependent methyltransferase
MLCFADEAETCDFLSLGEFDDRSGKIGSVQVLRCKRCGHGISMPPLPDIDFLYEDRQSQDFQPRTRGLTRVIKNLAFRFQARKLLRQIGQSRGRILDFGCGSGQFTRVLGELSPGIHVVGADMHAESPKELVGKQYLGSSELGNFRGVFDVVMAMHVIEHDDDPEKLLIEIARYARPGGKVVVEVPNIDCVWASSFGRNWDAWYLPYHRQHFTRTSLTRLINRCGLQVESVYELTIPTMGRTFANMFGSSNNLCWVLIGILAHPVQLAREAWTGRRSGIRIIAIKPS